MKEWLKNNYYIKKRSKTGNVCQYPNSEAAKNKKWWTDRNVEVFYDALKKIGYSKMTDNVYYFINGMKSKPLCKKCKRVLERPHMEYCSRSCRSSMVSKEKRYQISESNKKTKRNQFKNRFDESTWKEWNNKEFLQEKYNEGKVELISKYFNVSFTLGYNHVVANKISIDHNNSTFENKICQLLEDYDIFYERRTYKILKNKELDIFIPSKKIAIEINGLYWHSEIAGNKDKFYHLVKTKECEEQGIKLFHVFSPELFYKEPIWKSVILDSLGIHKTVIGARSTVLKEISYQEFSLFCEENHLQGSSKTNINYGLFYANELVSVMSFSKARMTDADWEMQRFCNKLNYKVHGSASKLLKRFMKEHSGKIVSYANRRWSKGDLYEKLGFSFVHDSNPNYFYFKGSGNWDHANLESRIKFQKHKLQRELEIFDENQSEWNNMQMNGYDRIWDCGNKVYILTV